MTEYEARQALADARRGGEAIAVRAVPAWLDWLTGIVYAVFLSVQAVPHVRGPVLEFVFLLLVLQSGLEMLRHRWTGVRPGWQFRVAPRLGAATAVFLLALLAVALYLSYVHDWWWMWPAVGLVDGAVVIITGRLAARRFIAQQQQIGR